MSTEKIRDKDADFFSYNDAQCMIGQAVKYALFGYYGIDSHPGDLLTCWFILQDNKSDLPLILPTVPDVYYCAFGLKDLEELASVRVDQLAHIDRLVAHLAIVKNELRASLARTYELIGEEQEKVCKSEVSK